MFVYVLLFEIQLSRMRGFVISLTSLTPPHCCTCPKPRPGFSSVCVLVDVVFNCLRWRAVCSFCLYLCNSLPVLRWINMFSVLWYQRYGFSAFRHFLYLQNIGNRKTFSTINACDIICKINLFIPGLLVLIRLVIKIDFVSHL